MFPRGVGELDDRREAAASNPVQAAHLRDEVTYVAVTPQDGSIQPVFPVPSPHAS
jgi:hypothetical protein